MMVPDFNALHEQLADLSRFAVKQRAEESVTTLGEAIERDKRRLATSFLSARHQIDSPYTGVCYAAWEIGQTIIALAGFNALGNAVDRIERDVGPKQAEWLTRRWTGLEGSNGEVWSD